MCIILAGFQGKFILCKHAVLGCVCQRLFSVKNYKKGA